MKKSNSILEMTVTTGENVYNTTNLLEKPFGQVVEQIKSDSTLTKQVDEIRKAENKKERDKIKQAKLPYFTFNHYKGHRDNSSFLSTEVLIFDLDNIQNIDEIRKELEQWKYTACVFTSPSGKGLKLIIKINTPIYLGSKYTSVYKQISSQIEAYLNVKPDPATCDPGRATFLSHDESIFINDSAEAFNINSIQVQSEPENKIAHIYRSGFGSGAKSLMYGVPEGMRHTALTRTVGTMVNREFDKEFIKQTLYDLNKLNQPPFSDDEFEREFEPMYESFTKNDNNSLGFYSATETKTGVKVQILSNKLIDFLAKNGFFKLASSHGDLQLLRTQKHIVEFSSISEIKDFLEDKVKNSNDPNKELVREALIRCNKTFLSEGSLSFLPPIEPKIKHGTKESSFFYFNNAYVEILKDSITVKDYDNLNDEYIWHNSIIPRNLDLDCFGTSDVTSEFEEMVFKICRGDQSWFEALKCSIGYMAHDYKDRSIAKAIILCDEEIPAADESNGGTGKSLVCEALKQVRRTETIDGKNFKTDTAFLFQKLDLTTEVVVIDDARKAFDFESLLSVITSDITIEKKHRDPLTIPFDKSPKFIITTNYTVKGSGNSFDRRRHEIEFSNYFNKKHTPLEEFGHRLFDDWDDKEWTRFFWSIAGFVCLYLDKGLISYKVKNLNLRRLIDGTSQEFVDFMDDKIQHDKEYNKKDVLYEFKNLFPDYNQLSSKRFTGWLKKYADSYGYIFTERKSNADRLFLMTGKTDDKDYELEDKQSVEESYGLSNLSETLFEESCGLDETDDLNDFPL